MLLTAEEHQVWKEATAKAGKEAHTHTSHSYYETSGVNYTMFSRRLRVLTSGAMKR